ncbi:hypothetical protein PR003_g17990 [Phytophthora rubi]|uniref:RxLR effector protein n=1 Tax=Phytophthora rubi TaxID=129364 RepID=A0A6A3KG13_9STRA|nr:hypothetical protein PR002_g17899 [Phytophthora rubi]KAE9004737.1 hypothetical protein PR001_g17638 [Phytophthora rubi]KAE9319381.1 hypothetical protein PR003_g17990 [Phytophthora rubi]
MLLVVAAAGLFAVGHATTDLSQTKLSQDVAQFQNAIGNGKRLLRTVDTLNADDEEERVISWADLAALFPGTAANLARKAEKETAKIRGYAVDFAAYRTAGYHPYDVTKDYMNKGFSNSRAFKMGLRFEKYEENPAMYH